MKKGLRRIPITNLHSTPRQNRRPDEEGIKTNEPQQLFMVESSQNRRPDEEGIKTTV